MAPSGAPASAQAAAAPAVQEEAAAADQHQAAAALPAAAASPAAAAEQLSSCACQRPTVHVLDISEASTDHVVTWQQVKTNSSRSAPEETILYTLTVGLGEIVMFGGIQKDVSGLIHGSGSPPDGDTVSNAL